jgi:hypothetical protein
MPEACKNCRRLAPPADEWGEDIGLLLVQAN